MNPNAWIVGGDTGVSSKTIWAVMMGTTDALDWPGTPMDSGDFGRCYRLLALFPEWRPRLPEVAAKFPEWGPLVTAWDELTALYESTTPPGGGDPFRKRMTALGREANKARGMVEISPGCWIGAKR